MKKKFILMYLIVTIAILTACSTDAEDDSNSSVPEPTAIANVPEPTSTTNIPEQPEKTESEEEKTEEIQEEINQAIFATDKIVENLDDYVLRADDMPNQYRLVEDGEQHITNKRVINTVGEVEGKRYLAATNRVDGWSLELERVNKEDLVPYTIVSQIEVFESVEGSEAAFSADWFHAYTNEEKEPNWVKDGCDIGDVCVIYYYEKLDPTTELTTLQYEVAFIFKNILAQVMGRGLDFDMNPDYLVEAAELQFDKISLAPLVE